MDQQTAALTLIFVTTVGVALILFSPLVVFRKPDQPHTESLGRAFGPLTPALAALLPVSAEGREAIRKRLLLAGHYRPTALGDYLALRAVSTVIPLVGCWLLALLCKGSLSLAFFLVGLALGALGFSVVRLLVEVQGQARAEEIRRGLPTFMDTLGLVLSSGASLGDGMKRAADAIQRGYPELAQEVRLVAAQAELRSMAHALEQWRERIPLPELGSLVFLLAQSDRLGTDITRGLWELSASFQITSRQRAEAAANRANFHMLFPTVLCLMIAAGIMLAGPGLVQLAEARDEFRRVMEQARKNQQEANRSGQVLNESLAGKANPTPPR